MERKMGGKVVMEDGVRSGEERPPELNQVPGNSQLHLTPYLKPTFQLVFSPLGVLWTSSPVCCLPFSALRLLQRNCLLATHLCLSWLRSKAVSSGRGNHFSPPGSVNLLDALRFLAELVVT